MKLIDEINAKCTPEVVAKQNCHAIAEIVSAGRTKTSLVTIAALQQYLQTSGAWWVIKATAAGPAHPAKDAAQAIMDVANARYDNIDMSLPFMAQMLGALTDAKVITLAQEQALVRLGVTPDPVGWQQVQDALLGV